MKGKAMLRRLIAATSVGPIAVLYRGIYWALIHLAVRRLRRFPSLRAVYLRRGLAGEGCLPGISDIDLAVVGNWDSTTQNRVAESYRSLARKCPIYDPTIGVYTPESIERLFRIDPFQRHRLSEGRKKWRLLFGGDCLSRLPPIPDNGLLLGYESEVKLWWTYFARWAFAAGNERYDSVFLNSLCYKVVAECIRMDCALRGKPVPESRKRAIEEALPGGNDVGNEVFLTRLRDSAKGRFLSYPGSILEESQSFLFSFLEQLYAHLETSPGWCAPANLAVRLDAPREERIHTPQALRTCEAIAERARGLLDGAYGRVQAVSGAAFAMDELVILFEPLSPDTLPNTSELGAIARACSGMAAPLRSRISLFLRLPSAACQFFASDYYRGWQTILSPGANPDIFLRAENRVAEQGRWRKPALAFIRQERLLLAEILDDPVIYKANTLDFLRIFWKSLELTIADQSARTGEIILAQTPEAVVRGLTALNLPPAPFLERFAAAYRAELAGSPAHIDRSIPAAIHYLKAVHHDL